MNKVSDESLISRMTGDFVLTQTGDAAKDILNKEQEYLNKQIRVLSAEISQLKRVSFISSTGYVALNANRSYFF